MTAAHQRAISSTNGSSIVLKRGINSNRIALALGGPIVLCDGSNLTALVQLVRADYLSSNNLVELVPDNYGLNAILGDHLNVGLLVDVLAVAHLLSEVQGSLGEGHIALGQGHFGLLLATCPIGHLNSLWDGGARANCGKERVLGVLQRVWTVLGDVDERLLHLQGAVSFSLLSLCALIGNCGLLLLDS